MGGSVWVAGLWTPAFLVFLGFAVPAAAAPPGKPVVAGERDRICSARCASENKVGAFEYERCLRECFATFGPLLPSGAPGAAGLKK